MPGTCWKAPRFKPLSFHYPATPSCMAKLSQRLLKLRTAMPGMASCKPDNDKHPQSLLCSFGRPRGEHWMGARVVSSRTSSTHRTDRQYAWSSRFCVAWRRIFSATPFKKIGLQYSVRCWLPVSAPAIAQDGCIAKRQRPKCQLPKGITPET